MKTQQTWTAKVVTATDSFQKDESRKEEASSFWINSVKSGVSLRHEVDPTADASC